MTTPTPLHLDPMPCEDSTLECFLCGMAVAAVLPAVLWTVANPAVAAALAAGAVVTVVALAGLVGRNLPRRERGE